MSSMLNEINDAIARFHAGRTRIFCTPARYDALSAALEAAPDLRGHYELIASPILTDDSKVILANGVLQQP